MASRWNDLGEIVRAERARKHLTQKELAGMVKASPATISAIENDSRNITLFTLLRILDALDIKYDIGGKIKSGQNGSTEVPEQDIMDVIGSFLRKQRKVG